MTIDFQKIAEWAEQKWRDAASWCQDNLEGFPSDYYETKESEAKPFFEVEWVVDSGGISGALQLPDANGRANCCCSALITHSDGTRDPSVPLDSYAQTVRMEMLCPEAFRQFLVAIWERFADSIRSIAVEIGGQACVVKASALPTFGAKEAAYLLKGQPTSEYFKVTMNFVVVAYASAYAVNAVGWELSLYSDGGGSEPMEDDEGNSISGALTPSNIVFSSAKETRADASIESATIRFKENSRQLVLDISGILPADVIGRAILKEAETGAYFGCIWRLKKTMAGVVTEADYICDTAVTSYSYGSLVSYKIRLKPTF